MDSDFNEKETCVSLMRWIIYFCILMGGVFSLWYFAGQFKTATFEEYGIVENLQLFLLLVASVSFLGQAVLKTSYRSLSFLLGALCLTAFCRELDAWFDALWAPGWKFALLFPVVALFYAARYKNDFRKSVFAFLNKSSFFMMFCTAIIILPIAQCVGHKSFFVDALGYTSDPRLVRRLFEEAVEYIGYLLLALSSLEFYIVHIWLCVKSSHKKRK